MNKVAELVLILLIFQTPTLMAQSPDERAAELKDHIELTLPAGDGAHPLAILLPGCLSWHPHHTRWREELVRRGYAVLHVDSFSARGLEGRATLERLVCSGVQLHGDERAGDLMAVLAQMVERPDIDFSRTVVFGWSHGGWTAMDFLFRLEGGLLPSNLAVLPDLNAITFASAFLFYPYCGPGSLGGEGAYPAHTRTLVFHGARDVITNPQQCRARTEVLAKAGAQIEFISLNDVGHWFDNHAEPSTYDVGATQRARAAIDEVMAELPPAGSAQ